MRIWVQKSASMQERTSPLKFAHLAEKSRLNSVSNLSTKLRADALGRLRARPRGRDARVRDAGAVGRLVERFDTEFNPDFSAKSPNFRGLVLFCIEADFCTQIRILQH